MSRVGKKPIPLPKGVKITLGGDISVEGPKGKLRVPLPSRNSNSSGGRPSGVDLATPISTLPCTVSLARWPLPPSKESPPVSRANSTLPASDSAPM